MFGAYGRVRARVYVCVTRTLCLTESNNFGHIEIVRTKLPEWK